MSYNNNRGKDVSHKGNARNFRASSRGRGASSRPAPTVQKRFDDLGAGLPSDGPPPPRHLSTVGSELKNDPCRADSLFPDPSRDGKAIPVQQKIYPVCDGLPVILEQLYDKLGALSHNYKRYVSESMHNYYFASLTYARLLYLVWKNKQLIEVEEQRYVEQIVDDSPYEVPITFGRYLSGFGNTKTPGGVDQRFAMKKPQLSRINVKKNETLPGYFGKIEENSGRYSSYPCVAVYAQRVIEDFRYTVDRGRNPRWDLPPRFRMQDHPINQNCLGYSKSRIMTKEQREGAEKNGVDEESMPSNNKLISFNEDLLGYVHKYLREIRVAKLQPIPIHVEGSQAQLVTTLIDEVNFNDMIYKCKSGQEIMSSVFMIGGAHIYRFPKINYDQETLLRLYPNDMDEEEPPLPEYLIDFQANSLGWDGQLDLFRFQGEPFSQKLRVEGMLDRELV